MTYVDFVCEMLKDIPVDGTPIYTKKIAEKLAEEYNVAEDKASSATAVAFKRIIDSNIVPELRFYRRGIYYKTTLTPFGEIRVNKKKLIVDKYIFPDIGYETGISFMLNIGLTTQVPKVRTIATNTAKGCSKFDKELDVRIKKPKAFITSDNKEYLQLLDVLYSLHIAPIDVEEPYELLAEYIKKNKLDYGKLLAMANDYYNRKTILELARVASAGYLK